MARLVREAYKGYQGIKAVAMCRDTGGVPSGMRSNMPRARCSGQGERSPHLIALCGKGPYVIHDYGYDPSLP